MLLSLLLLGATEVDSWDRLADEAVIHFVLEGEPHAADAPSGEALPLCWLQRSGGSETFTYAASGCSHAPGVGWLGLVAIVLLGRRRR